MYLLLLSDEAASRKADADLGQAKLTLARRSFLAFSFQPRNNFPPGFDSGLFNSYTTLHLLKMASKTFARTLRTASKQKIPSQTFQKRPFTSVLATRPAVVANARAAVPAVQQQTRGIKTIDFAGTKETVFGTSILASTEYTTNSRQNEKTGPGRSSW